MLASASIAGLGNGVASDYHAVADRHVDVARNWWDPFKTNLDPR